MTPARTLALAIVAIAVAVAAWLLATRPTPGPPPSTTVTREVKPPDATKDGTTRSDARTRWEDRRARIRAAHAPRPPAITPSQRSASPSGCDEDDCADDPAEHGSDAVFSSFIDETTTLTQGCEELMGTTVKSVRIHARLIGAPEIGTIVESVDVTAPAGQVDALAECLAEGMYTLELGDASSSFERDAVLMHGLLDEVANEGWLTPEQITEIRQQMIDGGLDPAVDAMVAVGADDPAATPAD